MKIIYSQFKNFVGWYYAEGMFAYCFVTEV